ncbi:MAG: fatty acid desaturase [Cyanobacteria bacterium SZAS LIN-5]|nr:fatty acid desaturase [Cyanobacteria bacterium SZAS LIN-5]
MQVFEWVKFLDSDYFPAGAENVRRLPRSSSPGRWMPFILMHLACLSVFFTGTSPAALIMALTLCIARMFAITAFYHRYFSHRSYKTSRIAQFLFAIAGLTAVQRGPLWWAAHHRHHHQHADAELDTHSPVRKGFLWAQIGWITVEANMPTDYSRIPDLVKYPELVFLNRFDWVVPVLLGATVFWSGAALERLYPSLHTSGPQFLAWGFVSTVMVFHITGAINSLAHQFGTQEFETGDNSKNNFLLGLITLGEGWHNNHHRYPGCVRQGLEWWQIDLTYYVLLLMEKLGIIWELNKVPNTVQAKELSMRSLS